MKMYLVLVGLIGLITTQDSDSGAKTLTVLLLRADAPTGRGVAGHEMGLGRSGDGVVQHSPRIEFRPTSILANSTVLSGLDGKYRWPLEGEDITFVTGYPAKELEADPAQLRRFVDARNILINGRPRVEKVKRGCWSSPIADDCKLGVVGRLIIKEGVVKAIELGEEPESLQRVSDNFDASSIWRFRSEADPKVLSDGYFQFASAVLVEVGDVKEGNVHVRVQRWEDNSTVHPEGGDVALLNLTRSRSEECLALKVPEPCVIVHVLNIAAESVRGNALFSGVDRHFELFSSILDDGRDDVMLPFRDVFRLRDRAGAGSPPSGRCIPKVLVAE